MGRGLLLLGWVLLGWVARGAPAAEVFRNVGAQAGVDTPLDWARASRLSKEPGALTVDGAECRLDNGADAGRLNGLLWTLPLNQATASPFVVLAESLFETGGETTNPQADYSIYLDVRYADGTSLYGQRHAFRSHIGLGWQKGRVTVFPDKPVRSVSCYLLYRYRAGRIRFRAPVLRTFPGGTHGLFDGVPVQLADPSFRTGFLVHDAADPTDGWTVLEEGRETKGLVLRATREKRQGAHAFSVSLRSQTTDDRALTLAYTIPLPEGELVWLDDPRVEIPMQHGEYRNTSNPGCGKGALSRWPFGAVRAGTRTYAFGYDPDAPAVFRVVGNAGLRRLLIAFDLGFAKEKREAQVKFVLFDSPGREGFRGALAKYAKLFPESFRVRIRRHGIWMAFQPISSVEGAEDFGFGIKEGDREPAWDDEHGVLTTHYTEPTSWWMTIPGADALTLDQAIALARGKAAQPKGDLLAKAWLASSYRDLEDNLTGKIVDRPWCKGACWNLNPLPGIAGGDYAAKLTGPAFEKRYAGKRFPEGVDGEYIDSAECHLPPRIDFRRENYAASRTPLCWDTASFRPGVSTALAIYEYVRGAADRVHALGRVMQANGAPYSWPWLIPFVDYGGQETRWIDASTGAWKPMSDRDLLYRTALSYGKPYCFLMNVVFENFSDEMVDKYFQRCLAYGLMSSFFSPNASGGHYFSRPELYNRHRPLFKKYGPLQRRVSEAGWRPVNRLVSSETDEVFVEQFGDRLVTVFNSTSRPMTARLRALVEVTEAQELVCGETWRFTGGTAEVTIPPESVRLLEFTSLQR